MAQWCSQSLKKSHTSVYNKLWCLAQFKLDHVHGASVSTYLLMQKTVKWFLLNPDNFVNSQSILRLPKTSQVCTCTIYEYLWEFHRYCPKITSKQRTKCRAHCVFISLLYSGLPALILSPPIFGENQTYSKFYLVIQENAALI